MAGERVHTGGPPYLLNPDEKTLAKLYELGRQGLSQRLVSIEFNVCPETITNFFNRCPQARERYREGFAEAKAKARKERVRAAKPERGRICPTCGGRVGEENNAIVLTPAAIA